ncbi:hypothetical protein D3C84_1062960 [compost metagenome]
MQAQLLIVLASLQVLRIEQFGVALDQPQQHRQQADAAALDDDAQLQVEPLAARRLVHFGVPALHLGEVELEARANIDLPALLAQCRQLLAHEMQPLFVAGQLEHFRAVGR